MSLHLTLTPRNNEATHLEPRDIPWLELASYLQQHEVGSKDGEALIPARFAACGPPCRGRGTPCAGRMHRLAANVSHVTALVVDLDDASALTSMLDGFRARGLECVWWHTYSHTEEAPHARLLFPFAEELPLASPGDWSRRYWPALLQHLGLTPSADKSCSDPARLYYLPRKPEGGSHSAGWLYGARLDWRAVLGNPAESPSCPPPPTETDASPLEDTSRPVPLGDVRAKLARVSVEPQASYIAHVLRGEAPCPPPDKRQGGASRYEAWRTVTHQLALCADGWMSSTALAELLRPSWAAEVEESPNDHTAWERVTGLLASARLAAEAYKAKKVAERNALRAKMLRRTPEPGPAPSESAPPKAEQERTEILESLLERLPPKQPGEVGAIRPSAENIAPILALHADWFESVRLNRLTKKVEIWGGPLLGSEERPGRAMRDSDILECRDWFARRMQLRFADNLIAPRLLAVAEENSYDPLEDYLLGLDWDGEDRLTDFLVRYFGASTRHADEDISPYVRAVGRKWLLGAVARGLSPGCQVDSVLELEGPQGAGKSSALRILGGPFFSDEPISMSGDKDSLLAMAGVWIVELAEMAAYSKSEVARQKEFISRRVDRYRPPYERNTVEVPRRCVFAATTNEAQYLADTSGNRRHWPVTTGAIDLAALRQDRDQIWAEAVARHQIGESCFLGPEDLEVRVLAEGQTAARVVESPIAQAIERWLLLRAPDKRPQYLTTRDVCVDILEEHPCRAQEIKIGHAMRMLGASRIRRRVAGALQWFYVVPERILQAPVHGDRLRTLPWGGSLTVVKS